MALPETLYCTARERRLRFRITNGAEPNQDRAGEPRCAGHPQRRLRFQAGELTWPGRLLGSSAPSSTTSCTVAMVVRAAIAITGPKLRALRPRSRSWLPPHAGGQAAARLAQRRQPGLRIQRLARVVHQRASALAPAPRHHH